MYLPDELLAQVASRRALTQVRRVRPVAAREPAVTGLYSVMRSELPLLAPVVLHAPSSNALTAAWALTRETWLASPVDPTVREAVVAAISQTNRCPYCEQTHRMFLGATPVVDAARLAGAVEWARATRTPGAPVLVDAPVAAGQAIPMVALAVGYHYLNRMVNVFLVDEQIALPRGLRRLQPLAERAFTGVVARRLMARKLAPGTAVRLLPEAALPADLGWSGADPRLAATMAGVAALLEPGGRLLGPAARGLVERRIEDWRGEDQGLSRAWLERAVADLPEPDRPAARLALLTALASYQVDDQVVEDARQALPGDTGVIEVAAWSAFAAARRIGTWLPVRAVVSAPENLP